MRFNRTSIALLAVVGALALMLPQLSWAQTDGWLDGWEYRRALTIYNGCGDDIVNYQVKVTLNIPEQLGGSEDGSDIRFTDSDGVTEIPFWVETWEYPTAEIWVRVPDIPGIGETTVYVYYVNAEATSASDGEATFIFFDSFENFNMEGMNAPTYLFTPTYDESGQVVHPDIVYVPEGWNGYEYWMAMTPYRGGNASYERPSVIASDYGQTWVAPEFVPTLIVNQGSRADTDMLLVDGKMILYYIYGDSASDTSYVYRTESSTDGKTWTTPLSVISQTPRYLLSPTVVYEPGTTPTYYMWYVRNGGCRAGSSSVYRRTSQDGIDWGSSANEVLVNISLPGQVLWHPDVQKVGDKYVMLVAAYPETSDCGHTSLYYSESSDGLGWSDPLLILGPSASGWDSAEIYRSSFLAEEMGGDMFLKIWYSARNSNSQWHVGYTEGYLDDFAATPEQKWDEINGNVSATIDYARSGEYSLRQVGGSSYPQIYKGMTGKFSVNAWLYDAEDTVDYHLAVLRVQDPGNMTYPHHMIGTGFYTGPLGTLNPTYYSYHTEGFSYANTTLPRTTGWHKLTINIEDAFCDLLIDDISVASLDVLDEENIINFSLQGYRGGTSWFDDVYVRQYCGDTEPFVANVGVEEEPILEVNIDIKPGSYPNSINLGSKGVIPVAILSSETFDATVVDPETVTLAGSSVGVRGKGNKLMSHSEDVNGDGSIDLMVQVETENLDEGQFQDGMACISGFTYDGGEIAGCDEIAIVPPE
jgi:hypothetical protein